MQKPFIELPKLTLQALFKYSIETYANNPAVQFVDGDTISYQELSEKVHTIQELLYAHGIKPGDKVALYSENMPNWSAIYFAVTTMGAVIVPILPDFHTSEALHIATHAECKAAFISQKLFETLLDETQPPSMQLLVITDHLKVLHKLSKKSKMGKVLDKSGEHINKAMDRLSKSEKINKKHTIEEEDLAAIIYTSGTTGPPKGAMLTHQNVTWMPVAIDNALKIYKSDNVLSFLPLCHVFERLFSVFIHLKYVYTVHFVEKPDTVMQNMIEVSPTVGYAVPRIWEKYYSNIMIKMGDATLFKRLIFNLAFKIGKKRADCIMDFKTPGLVQSLLYKLAWFAVFRKLKERLGFEKIRVAISAAAPISKDVLRFYQAIGMNLIEVYGQTEGTAGATISPQINNKFGYVGKAVKDLEMKIAEDGEILIKSPGVFKGYYKAQKGFFRLQRKLFLSCCNPF